MTLLCLDTSLARVAQDKRQATSQHVRGLSTSWTNEIPVTARPGDDVVEEGTELSVDCSGVALKTSLSSCASAFQAGEGVLLPGVQAKGSSRPSRTLLSRRVECSASFCPGPGARVAELPASLWT